MKASRRFVNAVVELAKPTRGKEAVAVAPGDMVVLATARGRVEARYMGRTEAGSSRWQVAFPWGGETFFGTSGELLTHAHQRLADKAVEARGSGVTRRP